MQANETVTQNGYHRADSPEARAAARRELIEGLATENAARGYRALTDFRQRHIREFQS